MKFLGNLNIALGAIFLFGIFCILYSFMCLLKYLSEKSNQQKKKVPTKKDITALFILGVVSILISIAGFYFDLNSLF